MSHCVSLLDEITADTLASVQATRPDYSYPANPAQQELKTRPSEREAHPTQRFGKTQAKNPRYSRIWTPEG